MNIDKIRAILNILFMIGALVSIIFYFAIPEDRHLFLYTCGTAIFLKVMEFFIRFTNR